MSKEYCSGFNVNVLCRLQKMRIFFLASIVFFFGLLPFLYAGQAGFLEGRILDISEEPVRNAEVYVFDSPDVKRPADFISNRTTEDGRYSVKVPSGNYWAVAIFRESGERFGPLGSNDKHSGDPVTLEIAAGGLRSMDFKVMNLREAARKHQKRNEELIKVKGRIVNKSGAPVQMAYAMAHKMEQFGTLPDYLTACTGEHGDYTLYLPHGRYYIGASVGFPPKNGYNLYLEQQFIEDTDKVDLEIEDFNMNWGQTHPEVLGELCYDEHGSDELLMEDYFWNHEDEKWYNKHSSLFTEREQAIADYLQV